MKIALYLGSFNPFHNGHRDVILSAIKDFGMDRVIIVPSMQNPWKKEKALDFDKRVEIICEAIDAIWFKDPKNNKKELSHLFNYVSIENIEKSLIPPYYSYATLHALKNKYCNDEIFVLCGEDTMEKIPDWMNGGEIIKDYNFLIVDRPKNSISSTYIREMLRTRHKMDAYYSDERLGRYVCQTVIELLKKYY